jgi:signal transduction histidine kinase
MKTITNIVISHLVFLGLFGAAALALAEEETNPEQTREQFQEQMEERKAEFEAAQAERQEAVETKREEMQEQMEERKEEMAEKREEMQEKMEERRAQLQERAQERITNLAANISNRMDAAIARMQNIIDRLQSRIDKLAEMGVDTTEAEAALESAQMSVDAALAGIGEIDDEVLVAVESEDVRAAWPAVKETFTAVRDHIKTAHTELRAVVAALKEAVAEAELGRGVSDAVRSDNSDNSDDEETEAGEEETEEESETEEEETE